MVKITRELPLRQFNFWSDAGQVAGAIADNDWETIEETISDLFPDGVDETLLNDIFRFDSDSLAEWMGYDDWQDYLAHNEETGNDQEMPCATVT